MKLQFTYSIKHNTGKKDSTHIQNTTTTFLHHFNIPKYLIFWQVYGVNLCLSVFSIMSVTELTRQTETKMAVTFLYNTRTERTQLRFGTSGFTTK